MMRRRLAGLLAAAVVTCAIAGCGTDADAEYARGMQLLAATPPDASGGVAHLRSAAGAGSPAAAFRLGLLLRHGAPGVPANAAQAFGWMRLAARARVPQAEFLLGHMLLAGEGRPADPAEARYWFEQAAEHDLPEAHLELAMAGQRGELGVSREETERHMMEAEHALHHRPREP